MKKIIAMLSLCSIIVSCSNFILVQPNSNLLLESRKGADSFSYAFPFSAKTDLNKDYYKLFMGNKLTAEEYGKQYLPVGIEELREKFGLFNWDSTQINCPYYNSNVKNQYCTFNLSSLWSNKIDETTSSHFTDLIRNLDPNYSINSVYRFKIKATVKIYIDRTYDTTVHYDAMLYLDVEKKGLYASEDHYKKLKSIILDNADVLQKAINDILYKYYKKWVDEK